VKIDIYTHIFPKKYKKGIEKYSDILTTEVNHHEKFTTLDDHERRIRIIESYGDMGQVLSITIPPVEEIVGPDEAAELARISNDEMATLLVKYPQKYIAAIANLPLNNIDASLKEAERTIKELGFKGVQIYTSIQGRPLSSAEFFPLYELMAGFDLPIWIHPLRRIIVPDYPTERASFNHINTVFGWPYETTAAMTRLVFAGVFEKFPKIKFITHHCGAMIPYFADRIIVQYNIALRVVKDTVFPGLTKHPIEYFKMFYNDTALNGNTSALMCSYNFFGEDHLLFGTDMPYDHENGALSIRQTIEAIEGMGISESSKKKIYEENARNLLHI